MEIAGHGQDLKHGQRNLIEDGSFPSIRTFDKVWNTSSIDVEW